MFGRFLTVGSGARAFGRVTIRGFFNRIGQKDLELIQQRVTNGDTILAEKIVNLEKNMGEKFTGINEKFTGINEKFTGINEKSAEIKGHVDKVGEQLSFLLTSALIGAVGIIVAGGGAFLNLKSAIDASSQKKN